MANLDTLYAFGPVNFTNPQTNPPTNATGIGPSGSLIADASGNFYGTTFFGGANGTGVVFELVKGPNGYSQTVLASFAGKDSTGVNSTGANPNGSLIADASGNLYGTASTGGANGSGTVFELVKGSNGYSQTTLASFAAKDSTGANATGANPNGSLIADTSGNLYGTASTGGANSSGTVFELAKGANGYSLNTLASFNVSDTTGASPNGSLIADASGNLYGTTNSGGANGTGSVFQLGKGPGGYSVNTLASFDTFATVGNKHFVNATGGAPDGSLTMDASGNLYGTTFFGGTNGNGAVFELVKGANGYSQTTLASFAAPDPTTGVIATGANPYGSLIANASGNLYGTATTGGAYGAGAVFELVKGSNGYSFNTVISFKKDFTTGANPFGDLTADASGNLYGTTAGGGANATGTVFRISNSNFAAPAPTQATNPTLPSNPNLANPAPCYVTGTRIRVLRGRIVSDVTVEQLVEGDIAITASGKPRPICWVGSRSYVGLTAPRHDCPVRFRAGAIADGIPTRDLLVSPDHALWIDGLFVAAGHLVNGTSITRGKAIADLTYWHVELDSHDLLLAENTLAESFLAAPGVRAGFDGVQTLDAGAAPVPYAPRTELGPELAALRGRLARRAISSAEAAKLGPMRAWLDRCVIGADGLLHVGGWAQDAAQPDVPVCLDVMVDGAVVAFAVANEYRVDLAAAGIGDGRVGFDLGLSMPLVSGVPHVVEVRRSADDVVICAMAVDAMGTWTALLAA